MSTEKPIALTKISGDLVIEYIIALEFNIVEA